MWGLNSSRFHEVVNISIDDAQMRIFTRIASMCYMSNGTTNSSYSRSSSQIISTRSSFPFSHTRNRFFGVGCNNDARIMTFDVNMGCDSFCYLDYKPTDGDCTGDGCCQISIPTRTYIYSISVRNYTIRRNDTEAEYPCDFAFVAADDFYNFSVADLKGYDLRGTNLVPSVLDWSVGNQTCEEAVKESTTFLCGTNSFCKNPNYDWTGYLCHCSPGYRGNAYLPNGCQDIDECDNPELNDCKGQCINKPGSYSCSSQNSSAINVGIGVGLAMFVVIIGSTFLFWSLRKRKLIKLKEKFFEQNGGFLLQQLVEQKELTSHMIKIFTAEELQNATKNYDDSLVAGRGGYGTVYKGTLPDGSLVAIKKSKQTDIDIDEAQVKQFISEVVILCQVNNRNIVHMLGCCLETPSPILVYEFVSNGTLFEHLHDKE
ncbi:hypothetical protein RD792_005346 [Penstemon davidsonii]|uniref:Protein kinase domain-containing protein n=1 Tax=Penstemon davidsonii TaxID=160366 RepID=A0ABR0DJZ2_9LAMI|nr:hypothetical protein RD792_005346 [Penstemon davidsonii]